jgi:hypothetical protein
MDPQLVTSLEVEAMVRRYLAKVARRYVPLAVALVVLLLVVTLVPTVSPKSQLANQNFGPNAVANGSGPGQSVATNGTTETTSGAAAGTSAAVTGGNFAVGTPGSVGGGSGGITTPAAAGSAGTTRGGVPCGSGVLQVKWSAYAPPCIPAYAGNNGGGTSYGVNKDTITAVFRRTGSAEEKAAYAAVGKAAPGTDDQYLADLRTYLGLFNKTYELYGRQLAVKDFTGQGDNLQEDQGLDLQGAQADAATAHDIGAFMDLTESPTLASTQPYEEDLAQQHVVTVGALGLPQRWFQQHAPWEYAYPLSTDGTKGAQGAVNALCGRAVGMPAIYSGDAVSQHQTRVFGLVTPDNDVYVELGNELQTGFQHQCGGTIKKRVSYTINIGEMPSESVGVVAQMRSAGVTTLICVCDPIVEITLSEAAKSQQYYPEWYAVPWVDPQGRDMDQTEWAHAISGEGTYPPKLQSEAYRVFKLAAAASGNPNLEPQEQYYFVAYYMLIYTFNLLQRAGPNLNPNSFEQSAFSMPRTGTGDIGSWGGGPQAFSPQLDAKVGYWDPNAVSNFDGVKGAWLDCEGGKFFPYNDPSVWGPRQQFHCFGH